MRLIIGFGLGVVYAALFVGFWTAVLALIGVLFANPDGLSFIGWFWKVWVYSKWVFGGITLLAGAYFTYKLED